jgi:hypothetical protein
LRLGECTLPEKLRFGDMRGAGDTPVRIGPHQQPATSI